MGDRFSDRLASLHREFNEAKRSNVFSATYDSLDELKNAITSGEWSIAMKSIAVDDFPYTMVRTQKIDLYDALNGSVPFVTIYQQPDFLWERDSEKAGLFRWIVVVWTAKKGTMVPTTAITMKMATGETQAGEYVVSESKLPVDTDINRTVLGTTTTLKINSFNSSQMTALVDTGASMCSLHATNIKIDDEFVTFTCPEISSNQIKMSLYDTQDVASADGGIEGRPVIKLNVLVGGKEVRDVEFNLNDRSSMEHKALLGNNLLVAGDFLIDPEKSTDNIENEESVKDTDSLETIIVDFDAIKKEINNIQFENEESDKEVTASDIVMFAKDSKMTLADFVKACRRLENNIED